MICTAYEYQPCAQNVLRKSGVQCCRECASYENCILAKCQNHPNVCGKLADNTLTAEPEQETNSKRFRAVEQYQDETMIAAYQSVKEASRVTGINRSNIQQNLEGFTKHAGGYRWKYRDEKDM